MSLPGHYELSRRMSVGNRVQFEPLASTDTLNEPPNPAETKSVTTSVQRYTLLQLSKYWRQEILAVVISAIAFVAIIVTLYPHDNKPLPDWPFLISINALVSVYIVILKASVLYVVAEGLSQLKWLWFSQHRPLAHIDIYDSASRGPWGSLKLLVAVGPRQFLAAVGAVITILMLMVDPFTQQILHYYDCHVPQKSATARVQRTSYLDSLGASSIHVGAAQVSVPPDWQRAINAGIFSPGQQVPADCATGNCTFPEIYKTIGFCSICEDISDQLTITNQSFVGFYDLYGNGTNETFPYWGLNSSLPSGNSIMIFDPSGNYASATGLSETLLGPEINYTYMATKMDSDGISFNTRAEFILGQSPEERLNQSFPQAGSVCTNTSNAQTWRCQGHGAASCGLAPCLKIYNATVDSGTIIETLIDTVPASMFSDGNVTAGYDRLVTTIDLNCTSAEERSRLVQDGYIIDDKQKWLPYNISFDITEKSDINAPYPRSMHARNCIYGFDAWSANSLWTQYMASFFSGNLAGYIAPGTDPNILVGQENMKQIFNYGNTSFDRVNQMFHNISEAMTIQTRQSGNANNSADALGVVLKDQTCLRVRYVWLTFPAALTLMGWAFFVGTLVVQSENAWLPHWKSSLLPVLFHGLADPDQYRQEAKLDTSNTNEMQRRASKMRVALDKYGTGLKLVEN